MGQDLAYEVEIIIANIPRCTLTQASYEWRAARSRPTKNPRRHVESPDLKDAPVIPRYNYAHG